MNAKPIQKTITEPITIIMYDKDVPQSPKTICDTIINWFLFKSMFMWPYPESKFRIKGSARLYSVSKKCIIGIIEIKNTINRIDNLYLFFIV